MSANKISSRKKFAEKNLQQKDFLNKKRVSRNKKILLKT